MRTSTALLAEPATVQVSVDVEADPDTVYDLVTDLRAMSAVAEETEEMEWTEGTSAEVGAVFRGENRNGRRSWSTSCTVTDADPARRFAFEVTALGGRLPIARWQYDLESTCWGCRVTESTWDRRPSWFKGPGGLMTGVRNRTEASRVHIEATLRRLRLVVETD